MCIASGILGDAIWSLRRAHFEPRNDGGVPCSGRCDRAHLGLIVDEPAISRSDLTSDSIGLMAVSPFDDGIDDNQPMFGFDAVYPF
jgi:hypothetical protein